MKLIHKIINNKNLLSYPLTGETYGLILGGILRWCVHATELLVLG